MPLAAELQLPGLDHTDPSLQGDGALYRIRKGQYAYTAPRFRDYLQRRRTNPTRS